MWLPVLGLILLPHVAAAVRYDTIARFLRLGLRTILLIAFLERPGPHEREASTPT